MLTDLDGFGQEKRQQCVFCPFWMIPEAFREAPSLLSGLAYPLLLE